jgi:sulfiredoxin
MLKRETFPIDNIYVPTTRRKTIKPEHVREIAVSMLAKGRETPHSGAAGRRALRAGRGLHRLEAAKALGETTIIGYLVQTAKH